MSDQFVQQLCKNLDAFGTEKGAKNTIYRKLVNWEGESRWTLLYNVYDTLQQSADFVNSVMPNDPLMLDSLPARFMCEEKYKKQQQEQALQQIAKQQQKNEEKEKADAAERKKTKKRVVAASTTGATTETDKSASIAQEAILVAKNVDRVLSMRSLYDSLINVKIAISQFCNKKRYKNDEIVIALLMSLLNSANRIAQQIQVFLNELKAM